MAKEPPLERRAAEAIQAALDAIAGILGIPVWLFWDSRRERGPERECPRGLPASLGVRGLEEFTVVSCGCEKRSLIVPVGHEEASAFFVRSGHLPQAWPWATSTLHLRNPSDPELGIEVPSLSVLAGFLSTVATSLRDLWLQSPALLDTAVDGVGLENIRRLVASLATQLAPEDSVLAERATRTLARAPPLEQFVERLSHASRGLGYDISRIFRDVSVGLPAVFNLMSLSGAFMAAPPWSCNLCASIYHKRVPLQCVLSDLTRFWKAVIWHRSAPGARDLYTYRCPGRFTETLRPIFAGDLAVGAVYGGQMVESEEQRREIVEHAVARLGVDRREAEQMVQPLVACSPEQLTHVQDMCAGLADLTGAMFYEWCRAESSAALRAGLISAAADGDVAHLVRAVCTLILDHVDVNACSIFLHEQNRLVLAATTVPVVYVRAAKGDPLQEMPRAAAIGKAFYELGEGLTGRVAKSRRAIILRYSRTGDGWVGKCNELPYDAQYVAAPLAIGNDLYGVIRATKPSEGQPITDDDFELLKVFAVELSMIVRAMKLVDDARARANAFLDALLVTAHEFRGPLQDVLSQLAVLFNQFPENEEALRIESEIEEQMYRAKRQMDNSLALGPTEHAPTNGELGPLFEEIAQQYRVRAAARGIRITILSSAMRLPPVMMDQDRMAQVITNLIDNAVKYSFRGESIDIRGRSTSRHVIFTVTDMGIGIPAGERERIFEPFERKVVRDPTRPIRGTGIGLMVVRKIVAAHNGTIRVSSTPFLDDPARQGPEEGHTVVFEVQLPTEENT